MNAFFSRINEHLPVSPEDFVAARVHRLYSRDPKLRAVLLDRIVLLTNPESIPDYTAGSEAIMHIAPHLSGRPIKSPNQRETRPIEVVVSLQWEQAGWGVIHDGPSPDPDVTQPGKGPGTVLSYCWSLLLTKGNYSLKEVYPGQELQTVIPELIDHEVFDITPDKLEDGTNLFGQVLILKFTVPVDATTGFIESHPVRI